LRLQLMHRGRNCIQDRPKVDGLLRPQVLRHPPQVRDGRTARDRLEDAMQVGLCAAAQLDLPDPGGDLHLGGGDSPLHRRHRVQHGLEIPAPAPVDAHQPSRLLVRERTRRCSPHGREQVLQGPGVLLKPPEHGAVDGHLRVV